ncbi:zinc finger E-box-binding homeobox 1b isoform X1 [Tachysurus vachellii]|uniref:zinc finger E-box-binding homeobox 1b isoform X1 n=2 Tax=Tachysurus vachellii TaxID=175792 RepID=UPI00296A9CA9|nr:zinc finger E-box-binding homeobox 1b isoform X1 [Tachysurus vachellii]
MADGPRCKRRKQANPKRTSVSNYSHVLEGQSDSDDEDKLHIVEEDGTPVEGADGDSAAHDDDTNGPEDRWDEVKEEGVSEEDERSRDALVEEMLQQGDTAVIFPEAPEDEPRQGTPETSGHDENGTPDAFSQLLTCPYCSRGYKRYTSLKEHIKYRHEKSEDNFSCSLCSYTFSHRTQLDRHMSAHKAGRDQRHVTQTGGGGNRKFKCTECGKAFKYKHHLKEHLRIHSGEKPYECPNCKKRFSHSGSYSSHISSKKCIGLIPVNGRPRPSPTTGGTKTPQCPSPSLPSSPANARTQTRDKLDHSKPLQEQLPITQIKSEPLDYEYKPVVVTSAAPGGVNRVFQGGAAASLQGAVQAVVLPTVGLVSPISINLGDLQNMLKVAVDGNVIRQVLENAQTKGQPTTTGRVAIAQAPQQVIQAISLPIVDQDGTAKIIINYSLDPSQAQAALQNLKKEPEEQNTDSCKTERLPEDLTVKSKSTMDKTTITVNEEWQQEKGKLYNHTTNTHCDKKDQEINGTHLDDKPEADVGLCPEQPPLKNLMSLLKAYYALNAEPTKEELAKISESVNLPTDIVRKWFEKMQNGQIPMEVSTTTPQKEQTNGIDINDTLEETLMSLSEDNTKTKQEEEMELRSPAEGTTAGISGTENGPTSPLPLNLSADGPVPAQTAEEGDGPLDLSLPKSVAAANTTSAHSVYLAQDEPLNLVCTKKEVLNNAGTSTAIYASQTSANPLNIVTTQLPTLVAITKQGSEQCLRTLTTTKQTILIPQLAYTYTTTASSPAGGDTPQKAILQVNGVKEEKQDASSEVASMLEEQTDSDSGPVRKKMKKTENGLYACDLCDKIFQKSSSLLRHKYEHTGKRPHECGICSKAFKHKHHLIEHLRLHSGEKPYQCDKCGKRFSHSGSYSQHMNHRYSYCKKEAHGQSLVQRDEEEENPTEERPGAASTAASPPSQVDSDERGSSAREDEESEEEDAIGSGSVLDEDEIQVVRIGEEGGEDEEDTGEQYRMEEMDTGNEEAVSENGEQEEVTVSQENEDDDGEMMKVVVMQDDEDDEEQRENTETMDMQENIGEKQAEDEGENVKEEGDGNEGNTPSENGDVK